MSKVRNIDNMAFHIVGHENVIFNIKPLRYTLDNIEGTKVHVKLNVTFTNGEAMLLHEFSKALDRLSEILATYKLHACVVTRLGDEGSLAYDANYTCTMEERISLQIRLDEQSVIDLEGLTLLVPYVHRYQDGRFKIDQNLIINYLRDFLDHASCIVNRG